MRRAGLRDLNTQHEDLIMSSHMPPIPPGNRSKKFGKSEREVSNDKKLVKHEHHANAAEEGDTANIKQNTTNKGYFRGRRQG
jgi:predicted phosphohydrolase